jgi:AcrR family transcriptional regulator
MKKETGKAQSRNKEKSKQQLLDAVGKILKTQGYSQLKVNHIAITAGLDKKLIYNYFGSKDKLVEEYINSRDFWSNVKEENVSTDFSDGGKEFSIAILQQQFDFLRDNPELQKVLLWRLSEEQPFLRQLTDNQEKVGETLFIGLTDPHFKDKAEDYRAITALLVAGVYYLNLYSSHNGSIFCGLDLESEHGKDKIRQAISFLITKAYEGL